MSFAVGDIILNGKYRLDMHLGQGAFGDVYRAVHVELRAPRALKVLRHDAPGVGSSDYGRARERFRLEAQLGAQLKTMRAPHVIEVYDFEEIEGVAQGAAPCVAPGAAPGALVLVMEYAPGGSLAERVAVAREQGMLLPVDEGVRIAREVATGLAALHELDAVHRDVKPSNILFDAKGRVLLADFGLAQVPGGPSRRSLQSGGVAHPGTPMYMSPEQRTSGDHLTPASDIYALGAVLFEMLTGRVYRNQRPGTTPQGLRSEVPEWVNALVLRCLAQEPDARPWDGAEFLAALETAQIPGLAEAARSAREAEERERGQREREVETVPNRRAAEAQERKREAATATLAAPVAVAAVKAIRRGSGTLVLAPGVEMTFVEVPAGPFLMGSDPQKDKHAQRQEQPQHELYLDGYWIGKTPVTNAQYAAFVAATRRRAPSHWRNSRIPEGYADHPVVYVSWEDAAAFCEWASGLRQGWIRLPTEAEWEKAARGTDGRAYPWGNQAPTSELCNFGNWVKETTPVGKYSPGGDSPYGCVDMAGNVWQWCADWYDETFYRGAPNRNPTGPASGQARVLRSGSWLSNEWNVRSANRNGYNPASSIDLYGFRCVSSQSP